MVPCESAIKMCDVIPERIQSVPFEIKLNHLGYQLKTIRCHIYQYSGVTTLSFKNIITAHCATMKDNWATAVQS